MFNNTESGHASFRSHVSLILILAMVFTSLFSACGSTSQETEPSTEEPTEAVEVITLSEEEAKSDITGLMKTYFKALKKGDVDALAEIMVNAPSKQIIEREIEYIDNYKNVKCFSKEGPQEKTYVAYVYYDVKFKNIDTLAPSMIREYICTNEDGNLYINNGTVDGEVAEWLDTVHNSEAVSVLLSGVNADLTKAASEDEKLQELVSQLGSGAEESIEETAMAEFAVARASEAASSEEETDEVESSLAETSEAETTEVATTEAVTSEAETTKEETTAAESKPAKTKEDTGLFKKVKVLYTKDITNVRKKASASAKLLGRLNEGKKVKALGKKDGWYIIKYGSKKGYIKADLLTSKKPKTEITFKSKSDRVEALQNVNMRKRPSETAKSLGTLPGGTKVTRTGYNKKWTRIVYNSKTVYVASQYVEKVDD